MIVFRYLSREVLISTFAVSSNLLLIIMSGRFVEFLAQALSGQLPVVVLLSLPRQRVVSDSSTGIESSVS